MGDEYLSSVMLMGWYHSSTHNSSTLQALTIHINNGNYWEYVGDYPRAWDYVSQTGIAQVCDEIWDALTKNPGLDVNLCHAHYLHKNRIVVFPERHAAIDGFNSIQEDFKSKEAALEELLKYV